MTSKKLTLIVLAVALFVPGLALAQGNGGGPPDGTPGNGQGGPSIRDLLPPGPYLKLTDEQRDATRALAEDLRGTLQPIGEEIRTAREALRDELESDSPGAAAVGRLVLETRDLEAQVRDEIRGFSDAFREILDPDQQLKYDHFLELRRIHQHQSGQGQGNAKAFRGRRFD